MADLFLVTLSFFVALYLRVSPAQARGFLPGMWRLFPYLIFFRLLSFLYFGTSSGIWRYVSTSDAYNITKSILISTLATIAVDYLFSIATIPRSVLFIDAILLIILTCGVRIVRRLIFEKQSQSEFKKFGDRALIFGAGLTGQGVLKRLLSDKTLKLFMVGFIGEDREKIGTNISGFPVFGGIDKLQKTLTEQKIKKLVVAVPQAPRELLKTIVSICSAQGVKPLVLNSDEATEFSRGLREIELKDLLVRPARKIEVTSTREMLAGRRVLITGAGGSVGSELSRQVLSFKPAQLILLDHSEFNLYSIDSEFRSLPDYGDVIVPCLADLKDDAALSQIFKQYRPEVVLHAAAYKHVHLVETNPYAAILNNVLGTRNLLRHCELNHITNFVLISTDKAVNPGGVMGSTKRVCEVMTSLIGSRIRSAYCSVRFGNVLGSSGSLIPALQKQIEAGKPLTITHPEAQRYFMLVEEAVALVLKAASISSPGDINMLRMGDPVKVIDIAKALVQLMGKDESTVSYKIIGLRPGEKMAEELYISGNELNTEHPDILVVPKGGDYLSGMTGNVIENEIEEMINYARVGDERALFILSGLSHANFRMPAYHGELKNLQPISVLKH